MLTATFFQPNIIARRPGRSALGAVVSDISTVSPFSVKNFVVKSTGLRGTVLPTIFAWAFEGELKLSRR